MSLVGRFALRFQGRTVELRTRKAAAVLGYLALSETKQESRERLVGLLWSRSDEEKARASLRQVIRELRTILSEAGFDGLNAGRLSIGLDVAQVAVDIEGAVQLAENARVHQLLLDTPRLGECILEGMDDLDPSFRVWVLAKRQTLHERLMRSLDAGLAAPGVAPETRKKIASAIVNLDPTHEQACGHLMQAHAEEGDIAGALRIYKALWDLLDRDYAMEPSKATEDLVARIKLGAFEKPLADRHAQIGRAESNVRRIEEAAPRSATHVSTTFSARPRLVLQPFGMHGIDRNRAHLVQGFSLHLAASLVRFRDWIVVDRPPATLVLPNPDAAPQYCIETTAYQAGDEINMVMVLKDDSTGIFIWSESFRLSLSSWFEAQQHIIRRIAGALNVQLSAERLRRLADEPDVSLEAYDRWLRGQSLITRLDPESWRRAAVLFQDAIRDNPTFSPFYASLAQLGNAEHYVHPGRFRDLGKALATLEFAKKAVELDPVDSRAHLCCGWAYAMALRETEAAAHMELACELNDNEPWTLLSCAHFSAFGGSIEQAAARAEQALALSPAPSYLEWAYHSTIRFLSGDYEGALAASDRAHGVLQMLSAWRAATLFYLGEQAQARQEAERFLNGVRSFWVGSSAPTDETVVRWALQVHPISARARWEALRDGLRGAGLPVEGINPFSV
jgi:DNA-binding SARP family transcriptional activator